MNSTDDGRPLAVGSSEGLGGWCHGWCECLACGNREVSVWPFGADALECSRCHSTDTDRTAEPATDTSGPRGTYGCACVADSAHACAEIRYGYRDIPELCECMCHDWRTDDD